MKRFRSILVATTLALASFFSIAAFPGHSYAAELSLDPGIAAEIDALKATPSSIPGPVANSLPGSLLECAGGTLLKGIGGGLAGCIGADGIPVHDFSAAIERAGTYTADGILWNLVNGVIAQMTNSIVRWINTGFEGEPAFVTDPEGFFADALDQVTGAYIEDLGLANVLCSPFSLQIRVALLRNSVRQPYRYSCTLDRALQNLNGFYSNFQNGGWRTWIALTREENAPYAQYINANNELRRLRASEQESNERELDWGNGFLSFRDDAGQITTPGHVIEAQLNNALDAQRQRLQVADSFNEILGALVEQLIDKTLTSAGGLLGLGGKSNTQTSYLAGVQASLAAEQAQIQNNSVALVDTDIAYENAYVEIKNDQLALLDISRGKALNARSCLSSATYLPGVGGGILGGSSISAFDLAKIATTTNPAEAFTQIRTRDLAEVDRFLAQIDQATTTARADIAASGSHLGTLASYREQIAGARDGRVLASIMSDYHVFRTTAINGSGGVQVAQSDRITLEAQLDAANEELDILLTACQTGKLLERAITRAR